jgi:hypothetical protein
MNIKNNDGSEIYTDNKTYPNKILRKKKNGQVESIKINYDNLEREIIVLEILEAGEKLQKKKNIGLNI